MITLLRLPSAYSEISPASVRTDHEKAVEEARAVTPEELFDQMDTNHDASLSKDEFKANFYLLPSSNSRASEKTGTDKESKSGFLKAFTSSTMMIIATEIGDKTFFIAAVMSMKHSRLSVFSGAIFALICMTILSTMMGLVLPSILPRQYTHVIGGLLFLYFGVKLIYDSKGMEDKVSDELEEVEEELLESQSRKKTDVESGDTKPNELPSASSKVLWQSFILTFLAEWGDRSQIATIALAAAKDPLGVTIGGCFGHSLCTGMAVIGGRILASQISEKTVSFWGGAIFLAFGIHSLFFES